MGSGRIAAVLVAALALAGCSVAEDVQGSVEREQATEALAAASGAPKDRFAAEDFNLDPPEPRILGERLSLWATYSYTPVLLSGAGARALNGRANQPISPPISERQWCDAALQGAVLIGEAGGGLTAFTTIDARGLPQADCGHLRGLAPDQREKLERTRFCKIDPEIGPLGCGAEKTPLRALRTLSVDPAVIPLGTAIYVPAARGARFTDRDGVERTHDGFFFAADASGAVQGAHIDVFVGAIAANPFPSFIKSDRSARFEAFLVKPEAVQARRLRRQHPVGECVCAPI